MTSEGAPPHGGEGDGCLVVAIRLPIRVLAVIVVLPVRLAWDALHAAGRAARTGLEWLGRRVLYPPLRLLGLVLAFLLGVLLVLPAMALWRYVLVPVGPAAAWTARKLVRWLLVVPAVALWRYVLVPVGRGVRWSLVALGRGISWLVRVLVVGPTAWLWRTAVVPAGLAVGYAV
ncbi:MAG: hypothetical protein QOF98_1052, partial [Streptomyces sp.]|nr:hypothetical protein [Streptomyces sp.]